LNGNQTKDQAQVEQGVSLLKAATTVDPTYADAHCLLAVATGRFLSTPDVATAKSEAHTCLAMNPPADLVPLINQLIDSLG
jgi:hypothetical protein